MKYSLSAVKIFTCLSLYALIICKFSYHKPSIDSSISYLFYIYISAIIQRFVLLKSDFLR